MAVALCALGAALVLLAAGKPWVRAVVDLPAPLPSARDALAGRDLVPQATALGLAGLAGLAGLMATRGVARAAVGVVLMVIGASLAGFSAAGTRHDRVVAELATRTSVGIESTAATVTSTPWWAVSLAGGVLVLAAGALTAARGRAWPGMSGRYYRTHADSATVAGSPHESSVIWDSLDRGTDPTADAGDGRDRTTGKES